MCKYRILLTIFVYLGAATAASANEVKFVFDVPVEVAQPGSDGLEKKEKVAKGEEVKLAPERAYWIQARGKVPVLVLPQMAAGASAPMKVALPDVRDWPSMTMQEEIDSKLGMLLTDFTVFQEAIRTKNVADAERALQRMEQVGRLDYLYFLRAALRFVQGDLEAAKSNVKRGLQRYPANEQGQKFLQRLEGTSP